MALGASYLRVGDGVLDVGCNVGDYATTYADTVGDTGYVWGIEPHPTAAATARGHLSHRPWVTIQQVALSGPADNDADFSRQGVLWSADNSKQASMAQSNVPGTPESYPVVVTTLDAITVSLPKSPRLIKIDAQGSEARILHGATNTLDSMTSIWVLEIWEPGLAAMGNTVEDVLVPFESRGYVPFAPDTHEEATWAHVREQSVQSGHSSVDIAFVPPSEVLHG